MKNVTMALSIPRFLATRSAIKAGTALWTQSDMQVISSGYLTASTYATVQNLLSMVVALPFILVGAEGADIISQGIGMGSDSDCSWNWLMSVWSSISSIVVAMTGPYVISRAIIFLSNTKKTHDKHALRAYKYLNATHAFLAKTLFLACYGAFLYLISWVLIFSAMLTKTGTAFPGPDDNSADIVAFFLVLEWLPLILALLLLTMPVYFYGKFLYKYAEWASGLTKVARPLSLSNTRAPRLLLGSLAIVIAAIFFFLTIAIPKVGEAIIFAFGCNIYKGFF